MGEIGDDVEIVPTGMRMKDEGLMKKGGECFEHWRRVWHH